jgi:NADH:ubiquinone oxidoreductase subunit E
MQDAFGYVPEPAIPMIAEALDLSRARFTAFHLLS